MQGLEGREHRSRSCRARISLKCCLDSYSFFFSLLFSLSFSLIEVLVFPPVCLFFFRLLGAGHFTSSPCRSTAAFGPPAALLQQISSSPHSLLLQDSCNAHSYPERHYCLSLVDVALPSPTSLLLKGTPAAALYRPSWQQPHHPPLRGSPPPRPRPPLLVPRWCARPRSTWALCSAIHMQHTRHPHASI